MISNNETQEREECLLFPSEPDKCDAIIFIKRINASLSVISSLLLLFIIYIFKFYQKFSYRLIIYLTVAIFLDSVIYLLGHPQENSPICILEAFWLTYSDWNVLLWVASITVYLFFYTVKSTITDRFELLYVAVCFIAPLLPALLPLAKSGTYGPAGAWCWVTDTAWRMAVWFVPAIALLLGMLAAYAIILVRLRRDSLDGVGVGGGGGGGGGGAGWDAGGVDGASSDLAASAASVHREQVYPLLAYPCVFLALEMLPLANRISNAVNPDQPSFPLFILSAVSAPIIGTVNFFLFYLNPVVRKKATLAALMMRLRANRQEGSVIREYHQDTSGA
ncbi:hypothetical protein BOX15_Mlig006235g1 [Macrostomum lignano]|uniref:G-protein coupled receptors family 2 profile 2 domain-containing protein n=2 Tax=Macrostomum lignano TaxID=282301 RepID=A0A267E5Q4_9PLAT|nr:hypothetical protein BOX15_Mlig006235g1 [Macrostomum lignano]